MITTKLVKIKCDLDAEASILLVNLYVMDEWDRQYLLACTHNGSQEGMQKDHHVQHTYTMTSAELKLLLLRLTFLKPGRPVVFEAGTTTLAALFVIQVSHNTPWGSFSAFFAAILTSLRVDTW